MKVLLINKFYWPVIGGVEKVVQDIAENLNQKVEIKVIACQPKGKGKIEIINGVKVIKTSSIGTFFSMPISLSFPFVFLKYAIKSDILHFHLPFPLGVISFLLFYPFLKNKKIIISWHSDILRQKIFLLFYKPFLNKFLKHADKIIVASPFYIETSEFLSPFSEKIVIIPFGIDIKKYKLSCEEKKYYKNLKVNYTKYKGILLFVGRLIYYKGIEYLIKAIRNLNNIKLILIGEGRDKKKIINLIKKYSLTENVEIIPPVNFSQLKAYYKLCDIFILPSIFKTEAFGLVQLEAMAFKKPIINTFLNTGVNFVSVHNITGLTVPPRDDIALRKAIVKLLKNAKLRKKYGNNGYKRVRKLFDLNANIDKIFKLYKEVLKNDKTN